MGYTVGGRVFFLFIYFLGAMMISFSTDDNIVTFENIFISECKHTYYPLFVVETIHCITN